MNFVAGSLSDVNLSLECKPNNRECVPGIPDRGELVTNPLRARCVEWCVLFTYQTGNREFRWPGSTGGVHPQQSGLWRKSSKKCNERSVNQAKAWLERIRESQLSFVNWTHKIKQRGHLCLIKHNWSWNVFKPDWQISHMISRMGLRCRRNCSCVGKDSR